jgi:hypothetical protein
MTMNDEGPAHAGPSSKNEDRGTGFYWCNEARRGHAW